MKRKKSPKPSADDIAAIEKLLKLTKRIKNDRITIPAKGLLPRGPNKWRSQEPKFAPKAESSGPTVEAGGMRVDPSLKDEYEAWRKEKEAEQAWRREQAARRAEAERKAREAQSRLDY